MNELPQLLLPQRTEVPALAAAPPVQEVAQSPSDALVSRRPLIKIARTSQRAITILLWKKQGGLCPLCGKEIDIKVPREGVMDHDHDSGEVRGILHRSCNAAEGKVANAAGQWGAKDTSYDAIKTWLRAMLDYLDRPGTGYMYPTHLTPEEKHAKSLYKRRVTAAKKRAVGKVRSMKPKETV